jgi:hypothetical protein
MTFSTASDDFGTGLDQRLFVKLTALVQPAAILGSDSTTIPKTRVGLQHDCGVRRQHYTLGFVDGLLETRTRNLRREGSCARLMSFHRSDKEVHLVGMSQYRRTDTTSAAVHFPMILKSDTSLLRA